MTDMMRFVLYCSQNAGLIEFRIPEIESVALLYGIELRFVQQPVDLSSPFLLVDLESEKEAVQLASRCVCIKYVWHHWAVEATYERLHQVLRQRRDLWEPLQDPSLRWRFNVQAFNGSLTLPEQVDRINECKYMDFQGKPDMRKPDFTICLYEEREFKAKLNDEPKLRRVWIGRKVTEGKARDLVDKFDLKKRAYIGTTSMESEVSFYMANQALAAPGKLVYDPFAGTGSMLLTSSAFGAVTFGSDIDGRQMRGKGTNVFDSASQYGVRQNILDCATFDMTQHPFRRGEVFDAIVTDPPYGVRAGAKRLGRKDTRIKHYVPAPVPGRESEGLAHELPDYVPPSIPWEMTEVIRSLMTFSLYMLKPGGRLVFFLPTEIAKYTDDDIPKIEGLKMVANSEQPFVSWARRLVTMQKVPRERYEALDGLDRGIERGEKVIDKNENAGHFDFRSKYWTGFK